MNIQRLAKIEREIAAIKDQIAEIHIVRPGSLTRQYKDPKNKRVFRKICGSDRAAKGKMLSKVNQLETCSPARNLNS
jgi:hypothetical protein